MQKPPIKYAAILYMNQINIGEFLTSREIMLMNIIEDNDSPINKYVLEGDV